MDISELSWGVHDFTYSYSVAVPEPATFAALFGALALVMASYKKRR